MGSNRTEAARVDTYNICEKFAYEEVARYMTLTKSKRLFVVFVLNRRF